MNTLLSLLLCATGYYYEQKGRKQIRNKERKENKK